MHVIAYFVLDATHQEIVRNINSTYNTDDSWINMGRTIKFIKRIQQFLNK